MNSFEFIMVLVSIIIGLGIAELLKTVSKIIRGNLEGGLLHILWSVNMLNMLIQCFEHTGYMKIGLIGLTMNSSLSF